MYARTPCITSYTFTHGHMKHIFAGQTVWIGFHKGLGFVRVFKVHILDNTVTYTNSQMWEPFIKMWLWILQTLNHVSQCKCSCFISEHMCKHPNAMHTHLHTHKHRTCHAVSTQSIWCVFNIFSECQWSLFTSVTTKSLLGFKKKKKKAEGAKWNQMQSTLRY